MVPSHPAVQQRLTRWRREQRPMVAELPPGTGLAHPVAQSLYDKARGVVVAQASTLVNQTVKSVDIVTVVRPPVPPALFGQ